MRIVSWNACCKFREKTDVIAALDPDVVVIPESENLERLSSADLSHWPHREWVGDIPWKGMLLMTKREYPFAVLDDYDPQLRHMLPVHVGGEADFLLLACWTQRDTNGHYTVDLMSAIDKYVDGYEGNAVIVGDLNSNKIWDDLHKRAVTHTQIVERLEAMGIHSAYHALTGEKQSEETTPTHALYRHHDKLFHIDYCFASERLIGPDSSVRVLPFEEWSSRSDHGPLIADFSPGEPLPTHGVLA